MKFMLEEDDAGRMGGVDHAFIDEYTSGFASLVDDLKAHHLGRNRRRKRAYQGTD